jgi:ribonucleoside-diphosphate reductase alpha chain
MANGNQLASNIKFYSDYARFMEAESRTETWADSVARVMKMHRKKYAKQIKNNPELARALDFAEKAYLEKRILGSQRALQWGGEPMLKHEAKMYNCISGYADRIEFFQETMYWLLCGCGTGFSVQWHHVEKLPPVEPRNGNAKTFVILDSIEGWSDAVGCLISSYVSPEFKTPFKNYQGHHIAFDYSQIRPKGSKISGGFKAPGPDGLRASLGKIEELLDRVVREATIGDSKYRGHAHLDPIHVYDIVMHLANAVLSGGVRRSATIALFSPDDAEMMKAKTGNWFVENPQRARSNNSAILVRDEITYDQFCKIFESIHHYGEPGFVFVEDKDITVNPCVEIGMWPQTEDGESGWQGCNLCEINGAYCDTPVKFYEACRAAAILGTLQAGYTNFRYIKGVSKEIFEREALLGVSVTGWTNNPAILFDTDIQEEGAEIIKITNKNIADLIGINQAARTTCVKPSGNASVLLGCASGIHGEHSPMYFRNMQMNKDSDIAKVFLKYNPSAVEESVWSEHKTDWVFSIPIKAPKDSLFKRHLVGVNQLELVRLTQNHWVEGGTNEELCVNPIVRHNVSNTIQVNDWDEVRDYIFDHRADFAGISLLGIAGDKAYAQAPFTEVFDRATLVDWYGDAALFASGLIVDGLHAFNDDLWLACSVVLNDFTTKARKEGKVLQSDWVRRAVKFANNYFGGDLGMMTHCLKDVYNYHKWVRIEKELVDIDWDAENIVPDYVDVDTLASAACIGGVCEI